MNELFQKFCLWLVPKLLSRGGTVVRGIVGWIMAALATVIPASGIDSIQKGLTAGGMAVLAIVYAVFQHWCYQTNQRRAADAVQKAFLADPNHDKIGNETLSQFSARTGIRIERASAVVQ